MTKTLGELSELLGGELVGEPDIIINGIAGLEEAVPGQISFLANMKYKHKAEESQASAVLVARDSEDLGKPVIKVDDPRDSYGRLLRIFFPEKERKPGIHSTAIIGENVKIGAGVHIGAHVVVEDGAEIGNGCIIHPGVFIGEDVKIGQVTTIYPNAVLHHRTVVGQRVIIHAGAVLGSDGFGFSTTQGQHTKIPQVGHVVIEDDVEIGACVAIDRATTGITRIGRGTKMDNLIQIGHNVTVGENCLIVSQVGIAGSTEVGDRVILGGQAGIAGHITIGDDSVVMAKTGVIGNLPAGSQVFGTPARPHKEKMRLEASLSRLPDLIKTVRQLEKKIDKN